MSDSSRHALYGVLESTYGTTPASPTMFAIRHTGTSLGLTKKTIKSEELRADRQIKEFRHGTKMTGGDIPTELSYGGAFDKLLEAVLLGTWATGVPATGTDQLKAGVTRRSWSLLRNFSDIDSGNKPFELFTGVEFNTLAITMGVDAIVKAVFGTIGRNVVGSTTAPASATLGAASTTHVFDSFSGVINEAGSPIATVSELSINLENGLEARNIIGSDLTLRPSIGQSNLSGQVTAYFEDRTLLDKFVNRTESAIDFSVQDALGNKYKFILPRIVYNGGQPDTSGQGSITLKMPFQAIADDTYNVNLAIERTPAV